MATWLRGAACGAACAAALLSAATRWAASSPVSAGGGADYCAGPGHQSTRSAIALVTAGAGPGARLTMGGLRFDDSIVGYGNAVLGELEVPVTALARLRTSAMRYLGDGSFRAWRMKAGPVFALANGSAVGIYYAHYEERDGVFSDGALGEIDVPVGERLSARGSASWSSVAGGFDAEQGALGLTWAPERRVALSGDVGLSRNGSLTFGTVPAPRRRIDLPGLGGVLIPGDGGGTSSETSSTVDAVAQVEVRVMLP